MLFPVSFVAFLDDTAQSLIIALWGFLSWLVYLPFAWEAIQVLSGLAFFGLITFWPLNREEVRAIKKKKDREKARRNLHTISNYFIVAFSFFILCGASNYLVHNVAHMPVLSSFGISPSEETIAFLLGATVTTGSVGFVMLLLPMVFMQVVGSSERGLIDIKPPPILLVYFTSSPVISTTTLLLLLLPIISNLLPGGIFLLLSVLVSYGASCLTWRWWPYESGFLRGMTQRTIKKRFVLAMALQLLPIGVAIILGGLHVPAAYRIVTVRTTTTVST